MCENMFFVGKVCWKYETEKTSNMNEHEYLNRVRAIIKHAEDETQAKAMDFNIFHTLNAADKEVMMCRVLYEFLNPKGKHGRGSLYLKNFLEDILGLDDVTNDELSEANIYREYVIRGTDRRIDIYIDTPYRSVPIEVKIYAEEQCRQCLDYFHFAGEENAKKKCHRRWRLVYLTLYGESPSGYSTGGDEACISSIKNISWNVSVLRWMENIRNSQKDNANVGEVVSQYIDVIMDITGQRKGLVYDKMMEEGLLNCKENMKAAQAISDSIAVRKTSLIEELFEKVRARAEKEVFFDCTLENEYLDPWDTHGLIKNFYQFQKSSLPALNYFMKSFSVSGDDAEYQLWLRFEIDCRPLVSFIIVQKYKDKNGNVGYTGEFEKTEKIYETAESFIAMKEGEVFHRNGWWVDWFYLPTFDTETDGSQPDFKKCNDAYYDLYEAEHLNKLVDQAIEGLKIMRGRVCEKVHKCG